MSQVEDILNKNNIEHRVSGADFLIHCLNPEHDDRNPSMRVNNINGVYHCFSCGYKGNIFKFFGEKPVGIEILRLSLDESIKAKEMENIGLKIPSDAVPFAEDYRGIKPSTYIKFKAFEYEEEFPTRIMFPIYDILGNIVVFHGRHKDPYGKPKYMNYPRKVNLPIFPPRPNKVNGDVILVEGIFDLLNLYDKGITNVVTSFGTKSFDQEKVKHLKLLGVNSVSVFFDNDIGRADGKNPGQEAAANARALIEKNGMFCQNIAFPNGSDPGSLNLNQVEKLKDQLYG